MRARFGALLLTVVACRAEAQGQDLARRILEAPDGEVRLAYTPREGVCGDGRTFIRDGARGEDSYYNFESRAGNWRRPSCIPGPARVAVTLGGGSVSRVKVYVGGDWDGGAGRITDLGRVAAPEAAKALVEIASRGRRADDAILGAMLADSAVVWPDLLALARKDSAPQASRKSAVFWLSQVAGDAATRGLTELAEDAGQDREIRDQAVFALSQLPSDQGVPVLIRLARSNGDPKVRRKAIFWLGQSDDPRALTLFEELLANPARPD